jgi:hypothetical protein
MSIELRLDPVYYAEVTPFLVSAGATVRSPLGGDSQRINRLGDRFGVSVVMPPLENGDHARMLVAQLNQAVSEGVIMSWPQVEFDPGVPGLVLVNGANQLGSTLNVDAVGTGYSFRHGQFGNFTAAGRLHLFQITADLAESSGAAALPILPMIRKSPADNSAVDFTNVRIEGHLEGSREWSVDRARTIGLSFTVIEK